MIIALASGPNITIPNQQTVVPDSQVNSQGHTVKVNGTKTREVLINSLESTNAENMPIFGRAFATSIYLLVDHDHGRFTISKVNPIENQNLVAIGPSQCKAAHLTPTSGSAPGACSSVSSPAHGSSPSTGSIVWIAIGGILAFVTLAISVTIMRRRRIRRKAYVSSSSAEKPGTIYTDDLAHKTSVAKPEMPSDRQPPQGLPLQTHQPYDLAHYEMPGHSRPASYVHLLRCRADPGL